MTLAELMTLRTKFKEADRAHEAIYMAHTDGWNDEDLVRHDLRKRAASEELRLARHFYEDALRAYEKAPRT